jgi:hypothetical protein
MSDNFAKELLAKLSYETQMSSSKIAFANLKRIHPTLNEDDPFALAYMAINPALSASERDIFKECLRIKCQEGITL